MMVVVRMCAAVAVTLLVSFGNVSSAEAQNYCPAADPNDGANDDVALQDCLNGGGTIYLSPGSPGYILLNGLRLRVDGTILTSVDASNRARLVAAPSLGGVMLGAEANWFELSYLVFDGDKGNRTSSCSYPNGHNLLLVGDNFVVRFTDSVNARCGSGIEVVGAGFSIYNNLFAYNGWSEDERSGEWADGITVHRCNGGSITSNQIVENTDVGLVINEGGGCEIRFNDIWNYDRRAFAGFHVSAGYAGGDHSGGQYSQNYITSGFDRMAFGLVVGARQWHGTRTANVGLIDWNQISGAVINLGVDSVDGGTISHNSMWNAQGSRGMGTCNGGPADNFIAADNGAGLTLQAGWTNRNCR